MNKQLCVVVFRCLSMGGIAQVELIELHMQDTLELCVTGESKTRGKEGLKRNT